MPGSLFSKLQDVKGPISVFLKYLKHFQIHYQPKIRRSPRILTKLKSRLLLVPSNTLLAMEQSSAALHRMKQSLFVENSFDKQLEIRDLSLNGCQLRLRGVRRIQIGDGVAMLVPGISELIIGRIVYVQK